MWEKTQLSRLFQSRSGIKHSGQEESCVFLVAGLQTWKRECNGKEVHPIRSEHGSPAKQPVVGWMLILLIKARQLRPFDNFNEQLL